MANINEIYKLIQYRANKSGFLGNISPNDFNLIFPRAEIKYYNSLYAQYYKTQRISDALSRFFSDPIDLTLPTTGSTAGKYTFPADLFHVDALTHVVGTEQYPIVRVEKDRLANHLSSKIEAPTSTFPIYTEYKTYLQFYPTNLATAILVYLKAPTTSVWAYTLVSGRPVYNAVLSVQPEWNQTDLDNIIYLALQDIAMNMRDGMLQQFGQLETQQAK
jgi:hypothetical protein